MKRKPELNLELLENFILYLTHCSKTEDVNLKSPITLTPNLMYQFAKNYIDEDHVDGYDRETEYCINLWMEAEEELRNGNDEKCLELKDTFMEEYKQLSDEEMIYVNEYLESIGG